MAELRTSFFLPGHAKQRLCEMPIALQVYAKKQDKASNQINVAACPFGSAGPLFSSFSVLKRPKPLECVRQVLNRPGHAHLYGVQEKKVSLATG